MDTCFPRFTAADIIETFHPGQARSFSHFLLSENTKGIFRTDAKLVGSFDGSFIVDLEIFFDTSGVGLPYNVFGLLAAEGSNMVGWFDYTRGCNGLPVSVFPGGRSDLGRLKLSPGRPVSLHIIAWGR